MNLFSSVQEQLASLSMKHAAKELESVIEKARQEDWIPLQSLQKLFSIE